MATPRWVPYALAFAAGYLALWVEFIILGNGTADRGLQLEEFVRTFRFRIADGLLQMFAVVGGAACVGLWHAWTLARKRQWVWSVGLGSASAVAFLLLAGFLRAISNSE